MHYLAHYTIDRAHAEPYFTLGLILPDIYRGFSRIYNLHLRHAQPGDGISCAIHSGIQRHYQGDGAFHNSLSFHEACEMVEKESKALVEVSLPRLFFLSHILVELLFDKMLLIHHPDIEADLYQKLQQIAPENVLKYFTESGFKDIDVHFPEHYNDFVVNRYVLRLKNNENIYPALERLYFSRVGCELNHEQKIAFLEFTQQCSDQMEGLWENLLSETKAQLTQ
jgi:hypothetical protein